LVATFAAIRERLNMFLEAHSVAARSRRKSGDGFADD